MPTPEVHLFSVLLVIREASLLVVKREQMPTRVPSLDSAWHLDSFTILSNQWPSSLNVTAKHLG